MPHYEVLIIIIPLMLLGYICSKSKLVSVLEGIVIFVFVGGYTGHMDLDSYRVRYYNQMFGESYIEGVYDWLAKQFSIAGIKFETFHLILAAIYIYIYCSMLL